MRKTLIAIAATALASKPALAHLGPEPHPDIADQAITFDSPIAGIDNDYWRDYQTDLAEANHELRKDLDRATDPEDQNDAWEEYVREVRDAGNDYAGEMAERGYRTGIVTMGGAR